MILSFYYQGVFNGNLPHPSRIDTFNEFYGLLKNIVSIPNQNDENTKKWFLQFRKCCQKQISPHGKKKLCHLIQTHLVKGCMFQSLWM